MQKKMRAEEKKYLARERRRRMWLKVVGALACVVVFCTTYALILPAIALENEKTAYCGLEEHEHTDECYKKELICGYDEETEEESTTEGSAQEEGTSAPDSGKTQETSAAAENGEAESTAGHIHTDACYRTEPVLTCSQAEGEGHTHEEACYEDVLTCGQEETEGHSHSDACYETKETLTCELEENEEHTHGEGCYATEPVLTCGQEETEGHSHTEGCYEKQLTCGQEEGGSHTHTESCYEEKKELICGKEEGEGVASKTQTGDSQQNTAGAQTETPETNEGSESTEPAAKESTADAAAAKEQEKAHVHTQDCYKLIPICEKEEHTHTLKCYSNPEADVETADDWEATLPETLSSVWADDLLKVAKSQLGYTESTANYEVIGDAEINKEENEADHPEETASKEDADTDDTGMPDSAEETAKEETAEENGTEAAEKEDAESSSADGEASEADTTEGKASESTGSEEKASETTSAEETAEIKGYTRYGAWYGDPYGDWNGMFVSFCLNYAEIPEDAVTYDSDAQSWIEKLSGQAEGYEDFDLYVEAAYAETEEEEGVTEDTAEEEEESFVPQPGDLVFFDSDKDGKADRVGIIAEIQKAGLFKKAQLKTIEGDSDNKVQYVTYDLADETILGYADLPENPEEEQFTKTYEGEDYTVTVTYGASAKIPEEAELIATELKEDSEDPEEAEEYQKCYEEAEAFYEWQNENERPDVRLFNIGFYVEEEEIEPASPVSVSVTFMKQENEQNYSITHFGEETERIDAESSYEEEEGDGKGKQTLDFKLNSFSLVMFASEDGIMPLAAGDIVTDTVSPNGTTINLFDYWVQEPTTTNPYSSVDGTGGEGSGADPASSEVLNAGINNGHAMKFTYWAASENINKWTGKIGSSFNNNGVLQGLVNSQLGNDGYPVLSGENGGTANESLAYLFDPNEPSEYKKSWSGTKGLLRVDDDGYYIFDCRETYAKFNDDGNGSGNFTLYQTPMYEATNDDKTAIASDDPLYQFFPFTDFDVVKSKHAEEHNDWMDCTDNSELNHYFGLTLTARFVQQYGGYTDSGKNTQTIFHFSGDDDVWIFVDGVLVADLGGIHSKASVDINFATGEIKIDNVYNSSTNATSSTTDTKYLKDIFSLSGNTFEDNTYHTLNFFYLERGGNVSNLELKYNLKEIPATGIFKVDQYGEPVAGAVFEAYPANADYTVISRPAAVVFNGETSGTTDSDGQLIFTNENGAPLTIQEIKDYLGDYFVLREVSVPDGYRLVTQDICLYIEDNMLFCRNTYNSGVWASANIQVTATDTIYTYRTIEGRDTNEVNYYTPGKPGTGTDGTLFAVPMKYTGTGDPRESGNETYWAAVYGTDMEGYTLVNGSDQVKNAIVAAQEQLKLNKKSETDKDNGVVFTTASSGAMEVSLENLPGDIKTYYYNLEDKSKTQYTVAYYWIAPGYTLATADASNTYRVAADADTAKDYDGFIRAFGATIEVPNLVNRMFVQKFNEDGDAVNGAVFALYKVQENEYGIQYVVGNGSSDGSGDSYTTVNLGENYTIDSVKGTITLGDGTKIEPVAVATTLAKDNKNNTSGEDGTGDFAGLLQGQYYLREISAPAGYKLNDTEIMVYVNDTAIYANAGTADDNVTVARGPGYVVSTLEQFASEGAINNTLTWVYEQMLVSGDGENETFSTLTNALNGLQTGQTPNWNYLKENYSPELTDKVDGALTVYLEYDTTGTGKTLFNYKIHVGRKDQTENIHRRLYTNVGWSYYLLYQDYEYGSDNKVEGAVYEDLAGQEISNLFSRSTYVQVTDEYEEITVRKVDSVNTNDTLPGAQFVLSRKVKETSEDGTEAEKTQYYNENTGTWSEDSTNATRFTTREADADDPNDAAGIKGTFMLGLGDGEYSLEEVVAPDGYKILENAITFTLSTGKIITASSGTGSNAVEWSTDGTTLTIKNSTGIRLPETGSTGTKPYTYGGLLLITAAMMCEYILRRKAKRRCEG